MAEKHTSLIKTIYFYFFTAIGLILLIIGIFQVSQWGVKSFLLPKYDLSYDEARCDYLRPVTAPSLDNTVGNQETESTQLDEQKEECEKNLEEDRRTRQVTDLATAITFISVGGIIFVFHYRRTRNLS